MYKTLTTLGFTATDAQVYVYLTTEGLQKARDIAEALKLYRRQLYRSLENLQRKGIVNASPENPARFSAVPFEKILELLIQTKKEQHKELQENREELLSAWHSIIKKDERPKS